MEIGLVCSNLIEKNPQLQQPLAEPCKYRKRCWDNVNLKSFIKFLFDIALDQNYDSCNVAQKKKEVCLIRERSLPKKIPAMKTGQRIFHICVSDSTLKHTIKYSKDK
jgi:hypothetical protein